MAFPATESTFRARFPEFVDVETPVIQAHLDDAEKLIDSVIWGDKAEQGHAWLTAHTLASTPFGVGARLDKGKSQETTYSKRYEEIRLTIAGGFRTI